MNYKGDLFFSGQGYESDSLHVTSFMPRENEIGFALNYVTAESGRYQVEGTAKRAMGGDYLAVKLIPGSMGEKGNLTWDLRITLAAQSGPYLEVEGELVQGSLRLAFEGELQLDDSLHVPEPPLPNRARGDGVLLLPALPIPFELRGRPKPRGKAKPTTSEDPKKTNLLSDYENYYSYLVRLSGHVAAILGLSQECSAAQSWIVELRNDLEEIDRLLRHGGVRIGDRREELFSMLENTLCDDHWHTEMDESVPESVRQLLEGMIDYWMLHLRSVGFTFLRYLQEGHVLRQDRWIQIANSLSIEG